MGKAEPRPEIPCTKCDQYHAMSRAEGWLGEEELQFPESGEILVGVVLTSNPSFKFARVSIRQGAAAVPHFELSGRLFRFASDTAVYFRAPFAGRYTVFAQCLDAGGWGRVTGRMFDIPERPVCQQVNMDAGAGWDEALDSSGEANAVPFWIR